MLKLSGLRHCLFLAIAGLLPFMPTASADVERIEVLERTTVADGKAFGNVGAYERLRGRLYYAIDASAAENQSLVDIKLAPRDAQGRIRFAADFIALRPIDAARGNGRMLYDVSTRGKITLLHEFNNSASSSNAPTTAADMGNGFLMEQGYTLLATGWSWDVPPGEDRLRADIPVALDGGKPIYGRVEGEITVEQPTPTASHAGFDALTYEPARADDPEAVLTMRDAAQGPRTVIARNRWSFGRKVGDKVVYDPSLITLDTGFKPGIIYTVTYLARGPRIGGLGLAAIRDALSFFRRERLDKFGTPNPLTDTGAELPKTVLAFGYGQGARVLQAMLTYGLVSGAGGQPAFDGAFIKAGGAGRANINYRFAQPSRHFGPDVEQDFAGDGFPFATTALTDGVSNETRGTLDRLPGATTPKLFYVNTATEYWTRAASLMHTAPDGSIDAAPDKRARVYMIASDHQRVSGVNERGILAHCFNPLDDRSVLRSLLLHLDAWITLKQEPPASAYPSLADGTLGKLPQHLEAFPKVATVRIPSRLSDPLRLDFGGRFASEGIADVVPPKTGRAFTSLVPLPDGDGLDKAGIRLPDIAVPLGTYTGWNPQNAATGAPERLSRAEGSFIPFARNDNERITANDPRPSLQERYPTREAYRQAYAAATLALVEKGLIQGTEVNGMVDRAAAFYDRLMARDPAGESCAYLAAK